MPRDTILGSSFPTGPERLTILGSAFPPSPERRRKVFISYFHGDQPIAQTFVEQFVTQQKLFIPRAIGLSYEDDLIDSRKTGYVIDTIRENFIADSTVQIVLIGPCTHGRRFIDWQNKRSLMQGNGLLGILLAPTHRRYCLKGSPRTSETILKGTAMRVIVFITNVQHF